MTEQHGDKAQVIKHLEMIQSVVNRLAANSFLVKGWSITILAAALLFIANTSAPEWVALGFILPALGFWGLDGYFLWQERMFRQLYDSVRAKSATDFRMKPAKSEGDSWLSAVFSRTLLAFYLMELAFIAATFVVLLLTD